MKGRFVRWLAVMCGVMMALNIPAIAYAEQYYKPTGEAEVTDEIESAFDSALLLDIETNTILYEKNSTRTFSPTGSAVNLMSAYVVAKEAVWEEEIPVIDAVEDLSSGVRNVDLRPGQKWLIKDLVAAMVLHGAQDAALVLSDHVSNSQDAYVTLMNQYAGSLGMNTTAYLNALGGYESGQKTTVSDLMLLCQAALNEENLRDIIVAKTYRAANGETIESRMAIMDPDRSIYDERMKGLGEGSTSSSGMNILMHLDDGENELLFVGYSEEDDLRTGEKAAKQIFDYFMDAYASLDVTATAASLLTDSEIYTDAGAKITPAVQGQVKLVVPKDSVTQMQAGNDFTLGELPVVTQTLSAADMVGTFIGTTALFYQGNHVADIPLVADLVSVTLNAPEATTPPQISDQPETTPAPLENDIPVYSQQDWQGAQKEQSFVEKYGFILVVVATLLLAAVVLGLVYISRRAKR